MFKKVIIIALAAIILQLMSISCYRGCESPIYNVEINELNFTAQKPQNFNYPDSTVVNLDSLQFRASVKTERVAFNNFQGFINAAYASDACDPEYVLKNKIESVELTANKELFGLPAGELLNSFLVFKYYSNLDLHDWIRIVNNNTMNHMDNGFDIFMFTENPDTDEFVKLNIKVNYQDGTSMNAETVQFKVKR